MKIRLDLKTRQGATTMYHGKSMKEAVGMKEMIRKQDPRACLVIVVLK